MKKIIIAGAAFLAFAGVSLPASAMPVAGLTEAAPAMIEQARIIVVRRPFVRRPACTWRTVVTRGAFGRRVVRTVRVCR